MKDVCNTVKHMYYSKSTDARSLIDYIVLSENCGSLLLHYDEVNRHNNVSDHHRVKCVMDGNVNYVSGNNGVDELNSKQAWGKSYVAQIDNYKKVLTSLLNDIDIPHEAALCDDKMCSMHKQNICAYHDASIMAMIQACSETIAIRKSGCSNLKALPGWNDIYKDISEPHSSGTVFGLTMVNLGMVLLLI